MSVIEDDASALGVSRIERHEIGWLCTIKRDGLNGRIPGAPRIQPRIEDLTLVFCVVIIEARERRAIAADDRFLQVVAGESVFGEAVLENGKRNHISDWKRDALEVYVGCV